MQPTPKPNKGAKASPVRVTKADGSVEMQNAYNAFELAKVGVPVGTPPAKKRQSPMSKSAFRKARIEKLKAKREAKKQAQWVKTMKEREAMFTDNRRPLLGSPAEE